jgi:hypothetical protein
MAAGARVGVWRGLYCLAGVVAGMALLMGVAVLGLGSLVEAYPWWTTALKWCGSAFLLWMAWQIATAPPMRTGSDPDPVGFWRALAFQWINPKSWIVGASAAGTFAVDGRQHRRARADAGRRLRARGGAELRPVARLRGGGAPVARERARVARVQRHDGRPARALRPADHSLTSDDAIAFSAEPARNHSSCAAL